MPADGQFERVLEQQRALVESRAAELVGALASHHPRMADAVRYALLGGGKRLRALLCIFTHDAFGGTRRDATLDAACALECVHAYSLVHDDLPCMDDDDLRRGKPSAHRAFDEATAVLAGDALLTLSFEILAGLGTGRAVPPAAALATVRILAQAAGTGGLIGGQALDLAAHAGDGLELVERVHERKTARLVSAAMEIGAVLAGVSELESARVREAGLFAGRAFQIMDDVLDATADSLALGKTAGKDARAAKLTYPSAVGLDGSRQAARDLLDRTHALLPEATNGPLRPLLDHLVNRSN